MPVAVMVVEAPSLRIVEFNDLVRDLIERKLGRPVGERLEDQWELFHPSGRSDVIAQWPLVRSITSGEEVIGEEYVHLLADGSGLIVRCSSAPIYDDQSQIVAGVLVKEDVTAGDGRRPRSQSGPATDWCLCCPPVRSGSRALSCSGSWVRR
jgi:PAS domain-containing protein